MLAVPPVRLGLLSLSVWGLYATFHPLKSLLTTHLTGSAAASGWIVFVTAIFIFLRAFLSAFEPQLKFIWHCFLRPIGSADQRQRLDKFYQGQAEVYDATRGGLLRGRKTMLNLSAGHLRIMREKKAKGERLVWIDIGGGTGYNIELMNDFFPIENFDAVYLIDLCEPLLQVARKRFSRRGWKNVTVLCQDASAFTLPEWSVGVEPKGSVDFVTISYALSMIPDFYTLVDRVSYALSPSTGLLGVVDFYTSGRQPSLHEKAIGGPSKQCGWLTRWFWQIWFDFDHVSLSPQRRDYLEYKFGTIKSYNGRNRFILPFIIRIPYYIWIGRPRDCDVSRFCHAFEIEGGNTIGNCSPSSLPINTAGVLPSLDLGDAALGDAEAVLPLSSKRTATRAATVINVTPPLSAFHYQLKHPWRLPYYEQPVHKQFRTFIYSFTWEDPEEDMKYLNLSPSDSMFVITSAGDNALHYAIAGKPHRIHCVDMNPCQGHLLELKLAAIAATSHSDFFALFGTGRHPNFRYLLDAQLSPFLSSIAYQFWRINSSAFTESFYQRGYSGWALRLASYLFTLFGVSSDVEAVCAAETIAEQERIWSERIRPVILNPVVVALLKNPVFCWNALGVPLNQRKMFLNEGSAYEFVRDTLDPIPSTALLGKGAYFYLLCLLGHYTPESCPAYLTQEGFSALKNDPVALDAFRLHTDSISNVLRGLDPSSLTRAVIMDHLDWFSPESEEVDEEVAELARVLAPGGFVLWRSAAKRPWYSVVFERAGFEVTCLRVRGGPKAAIDRVNMYASFWKASKLQIE